MTTACSQIINGITAWYKLSISSCDVSPYVNNPGNPIGKAHYGSQLVHNSDECFINSIFEAVTLSGLLRNYLGSRYSHLMHNRSILHYDLPDNNIPSIQSESPEAYEKILSSQEAIMNIYRTCMGGTQARYSLLAEDIVAPTFDGFWNESSCPKNNSDGLFNMSAGWFFRETPVICP